MVKFVYTVNERMSSRNPLPSMRPWLITLFVLLLSSSAMAQTEWPMADGETVTTCDGVFVDDGIENAYSGTNMTFTICPNNPGDAIQIDFLNFQLQTSANPNNNDALVIYQGTSTADPQAGAYFGDDLQGLSITANVSNPTGCLTFQLISPTGNIGGQPGWVGIISCTTPCSEPTQGSDFVSPLPPDPGIDSVVVCIGDPVEFDGSSSSPGGGFTLEEYIWNFDDGNVDTLSGANPTHIFEEAGEFLVTLTVEDNNGCQSLNVEPLKVIVSTLPDLTFDFEDTICLGETVNLTTLGIRVQFGTHLRFL
jgi:hypothetical protein